MSSFTKNGQNCVWQAKMIISQCQTLKKTSETVQ